ncbi:MAG TPA: DHA2 family efflux MFS transporter permease subunit [Phycisphaerae bacterium]|nr:DHA2 family efflux MFS transporter permease subunit [Phycisphaerae bacterium]
MAAAATPPTLAAEPLPAHPWLITIAVMLGTFMEVLDTSVANVALPHIAGSLAASLDESTWVLTSYLVSNAIVLPATGWLGRRFGRKNFLLFCIALFTFASFLCGAATSLTTLIAARILQGVGGGALQPIAQAILLESFPVAKRGQAMAAYAFGIVCAPIIGPTLGGWITDNYSWRWVFYINIPVGLLAIYMVWALIHDPAHIRNAKRTGIDYWGFGLMALWLGTLQLVLDRGQQEDWFGAVRIRWLTAICIASFLGFVARELLAREPLVNLRILSNRNFALGTAVVTIIGVVLYGTTALIPEFLQGLMGYTAYRSGLTVSPRGIGSVVAILLVGKLLGKVDGRYLITIAMVLLGWSSWMLGHVSLQTASSSIVIPVVMNGAAISLLFVPLSVLTTSTLKVEEMGAATGLYNLMRNIGGSVGISMVTTMLARQSQTHQAVLAAHVTPYDPATQQRLASLTQHMLPQEAIGVLYGQVVQQATLWGFVSNFRWMAILSFGCIVLAFVFKKVRTGGNPLEVH